MGEAVRTKIKKTNGRHIGSYQVPSHKADTLHVKRCIMGFVGNVKCYGLITGSYLVEQVRLKQLFHRFSEPRNRVDHYFIDIEDVCVYIYINSYLALIVSVSPSWRP